MPRHVLVTSAKRCPDFIRDCLSEWCTSCSETASLSVWRFPSICLSLHYRSSHIVIYCLCKSCRMLQVEVEVNLRPTVSRPFRLSVGPSFGAYGQIFFFSLSDSCLIIEVGRPLWRQDGFVDCSAITQWFESRRTNNHTLLYTQPVGSGPRIYIMQEQVDPVIPPGTGSQSVASYDSQGYGGGILTRLHTKFDICNLCTHVGWIALKRNSYLRYWARVWIIV
jgi:hypothetical protein